MEGREKERKKEREKSNGLLTNDNSIQAQNHRKS